MTLNNYFNKKCIFNDKKYENDGIQFSKIR